MEGKEVHSGIFKVQGVHKTSTRSSLEQIAFWQQQKFLEVTEPLQEEAQIALQTEFNKTNTLHIIWVPNQNFFTLS